MKESGRAYTHLDLGNAYRCLGRRDEALREYELARPRDGALVEVLWNEALLHLDGDLGGLGAGERLEHALALLGQFRAAGGEDRRFDELLAAAQRDLESQRRRDKAKALREERRRRKAEGLDAGTP
jgi:hypothetical protein